MQHSQEKRSRSIWPFVGVGCLAVVIAVLLGVCALGYFAVRTGKNMVRQFTDPEVRRQRVLEALGAEQLPEGWKPAFALSVPFVMDVAVIGDVVPGEDGKIKDFGERAFVFLSLSGGFVRGEEEKRLERFFAGQGGDLGSIRVENLDFTQREVIGISRSETHGTPVDVVAVLAQVRTEKGPEERLLAAMRIRCAGDARTRIGLWFEPPPPGIDKVSDIDLTGTNADPDRVREFLDQFRLCP